MSSIVPCLCWVPKGAAKESPDKVQLSADEVQNLLKGAEDKLKQLGLDAPPEDSSDVDQEEIDSPHQSPDDKQECDGAVGGDSAGDGMKDVDDLYDMENYDSDEEQGQSVSGAGMGNNVAGLTYYASNEDDPYITLKDETPENDEEDFKVLPGDNMLAVGKAEEDYSSVEVHVYSESDDHSYCHHEILLSAFPLALEWLDFDPEQPDKKGNYLAIGTMAPEIEIWDLDIIDGLEPVFRLGSSDTTVAAPSKAKKSSKKKEKKRPDSVDSHRDSVLGLAWNRAVQCVCWHPYEPQLLVTGAFNGSVQLFDCKSSESALRSWTLDGEIERTLWNHFKPEQLLVCTQSKTVWALDKNDGSTLFQISAHNDVITDISLSCNVPGLLATASTDDTVKFWDIEDNKPVFLLSKDVHMTSVLCAKFCLDAPYALAVGGEKNGFHIINVANLPEVVQRFKDRKMMTPVMPPSQIFSSKTSDNTAVDDHHDEGMEVVGEASPPTVNKSSPKKVVTSKRKKNRKHKS